MNNLIALMDSLKPTREDMNKMLKRERPECKAYIESVEVVNHFQTRELKFNVIGGEGLTKEYLAELYKMAEEENMKILSSKK